MIYTILSKKIQTWTKEKVKEIVKESLEELDVFQKIKNNLDFCKQNSSKIVSHSGDVVILANAIQQLYELLYQKNSDDNYIHEFSDDDDDEEIHWIITDKVYKHETKQVIKRKKH